ncbi:LOW QUALITY PROTEIN: hypothetical protein HJC23_011572 [Cyclotella cryptica]|uniref:Serpin domain-containing protein n=1 Tax=Cyclotella cryptica TaxID=29204 RepID=A0ABD3QSH1_9STRA
MSVKRERDVSVASTSDFATQLFSALCDEESTKGENVLISPISIIQSLALLQDGATSESANHVQLTNLLGPSNILNAVRSLQTNAIREDPSDKKNSAVELNIASSLWANSLNASYVELVKSTHLVEAFPLPKQNPFAKMNEWVAKRTMGMIKDLFDPSQPVDSNMVAVLVNTVYFRGTWLEKFDESKTVEGMFYTSSKNEPDKTLSARYMTASRRMKVIKHSDKLGGASILVLDYGKNESDTPEISAMFMLPGNSSDASMTSLISGLCSQPMSDLLGKVRSTEVNLKLPRFKLNFGPSSLVGSLKNMGMTEAFDNSKSGLFNRMTNDPRTYVEDILHGAAIEVTEEGTVAAAATGAVMKSRSIVVPFELKFNRPFVVSIIHRPSGLPLFLGRIEKPELMFASNDEGNGNQGEL